MPSMIYFLALICAALLAGLAVLSSRWLNRSDGPATLLCVTWAGVLGIYGVSGGYFYPVEVQTLLLFTLAPLAFLLGTVLAQGRPVQDRLNQPGFQPAPGLRASLLIWLVLLLALLPTYFSYFTAELNEDSELNLIAAIRLATLEEENTAQGFSALKNLLPFAFALPGVTFFAFRSNRLHQVLLTVAAAMIAILYGLCTGSKAAVPTVGITLLLCLIGANGGRMRKSGAPALMLALVAGIVVLFRYVNLAFDETSSEVDLWSRSLEVVASYLCTPVVGLDNYFRYAGLIDLSPQSLSRPFVYMANGVLATINEAPIAALPPVHLPFHPPGPTVRNDAFNTYSYLGTYIESLGMAGAVIPPFVAGLLTGKLHQRVAFTSIGGFIVYAYIAKALITSFGGELLFMDIANIIKFVIAVLILTHYSPSLVCWLSRLLKPVGHGSPHP